MAKDFLSTFVGRKLHPLKRFSEHLITFADSFMSENSAYNTLLKFYMSMLYRHPSPLVNLLYYIMQMHVNGSVGLMPALFSATCYYTHCQYLNLYRKLDGEVKSMVNGSDESEGSVRRLIADYYRLSRVMRQIEVS